MAKGSKWAFIKNQYPRMPIDAEYADRIKHVLDNPIPAVDVAEFKSAGMISADLAENFTETPIRSLEFETHVKLYNLLRDRKEALEQKLSGVNLQLEAVEGMIAEYYDANGIMTQKFDDGSSITVAPDPQVTVADEKAFYSWVKSDPQRAADFKLREYVFPQTAKAQVKALLENGDEPPPGTEVFFENKFTRRAGN